MKTPPPTPPIRRRIAILGASAHHRTEASIARAAESLGHDARVVDVAGLRRRLGRLGMILAARRTSAFEPDVIICTRHAHHLGDRLDTLVQGRQASVWYFDPLPREEVTNMARRLGRLFTTYLAQVPDYLERGIPEVLFLPQGVDPELDAPASKVRDGFTCDLSFVGSGPYPHRWPLLRELSRVGTMQIRGPGWRDAPPDLPVAGGPVRGAQFAEVVAGAQINVGASAMPEQDHDRASASNRMWKIMGCGGFYLGPRVPDIEVFARDREHCRWYGSVEEAVAIARELLAEPEAIATMAAAGRAHALAHHTYAHRLERLLGNEGWAV